MILPRTDMPCLLCNFLKRSQGPLDATQDEGENGDCLMLVCHTESDLILVHTRSSPHIFDSF